MYRHILKIQLLFCGFNLTTYAALIDAESGGRKSLMEILKYSVLTSLAEIKGEFRYITGTTGTRIIISRLRKRGDGNKYELDFITDSSDIRIPDDLADTDESRYKREQRQDHIPLSDYSLRVILILFTILLLFYFTYMPYKSSTKNYPQSLEDPEGLCELESQKQEDTSDYEAVEQSIFL